jgi:hypothetical protein
MRLFILLLLISVSAAADCDQPKQWWETAFPGSSEKRTTKQVEDNVDEEFGSTEESAEPEEYHWDNIYLEPSYPEVIIDPYKNNSSDDEDTDSDWGY